MSATATFPPVFQTPAPVYSFTKAQAPIGAGGFVGNWDQSVDALRMVHGADVQSGGYIRNSGEAKWASMFSPATLLSAEYDPLPALPAYTDGFRGMAGVRIAPSDKNVIYSLWSSDLFKTTDGGANQRRTSFGGVSAWSNTGAPRLCNPLIDVHPTDPLIILVGSTHYAADTTKSGAFYSFDGAATAKVKIAGLPSATDRAGPSPGRYLVAIDQGDPTKGYVHVDGVGLYPLTIGAGTMTAGALIAGSPLRCNHLIVTAAGVVYCAGGANGAANDLYKRTRAGVASSFTTTCPNGAVSVTVDPLNAARIVCADGNGEIAITYNGGTNWELFAYYLTNLSIGSGEIAWLSNRGTNAPQLFPSMIKFDNATANKVWVMHGTGLSFFAAPTATGTTLVFHDFTQGNEEKVAQSFLSVPGHRVTILGNWDYSIWPMVDLTAWNNTGIIPGNSQLAICEDLDYAINDTSYYVAATGQKANSNAFSNNKGLPGSWALLPNQTEHPFSTGAIAVSNKTNIITIGSDNGISLFTKDGGATWPHLQLVPGTDVPNMINAQYLRRKIVTADKARPGVFALVVPGITAGGSARSDAGLWVTLDGGTSWTKKIAGIIGSALPGFTGDTRQYYTEKLKYIPGFSGELLHTCHDDQGPDWLHHITNDGNSLVRLGGSVAVTDVADFDFGPVMPGQTRPCVGFWGKVGGVEGLYISYDWFATAPTLVNRFPLDNLSVCPATGKATAVTVGMDRNRVRPYVGGIGWNYFN